MIFGNRSARTVMFLDELQGLKDRYPDRLQLVHVLSQEMPEVPLFAGRIDRDKLEKLFATVTDAATVDEWFLCGPFEMVGEARDLLEERGVEPKRSTTSSSSPARSTWRHSPPNHHPVKAQSVSSSPLPDASSEVRMRPEEKILDAASAGAPRAPLLLQGRNVRLVQGPTPRG